MSKAELKQAVERLHNCKASHIREIAVVEKLGYKTVWEGIVHVFKIECNEKATLCYAWSSAIKGSTKRRYHAVLSVPPIDSPQKAVRASIVKDRRTDHSK